MSSIPSTKDIPFFSDESLTYFKDRDENLHKCVENLNQLHYRVSYIEFTAARLKDYQDHDVRDKILGTTGSVLIVALAIGYIVGVLFLVNHFPPPGGVFAKVFVMFVVGSTSLGIAGGGVVLSHWIFSRVKQSQNYIEEQTKALQAEIPETKKALQEAPNIQDVLKNLDVECSVDATALKAAEELKKAMEFPTIGYLNRIGMIVYNNPADYTLCDLSDLCGDFSLVSLS